MIEGDIMKEKIRNDIRNYLEVNFFNKREDELTDEYNLLDNGIIDSLSMMNLIMFIEEKYSLDFYTLEINAELFKSMNAIVNFIYENIED